MNLPHHTRLQGGNSFTDDELRSMADMAGLCVNQCWTLERDSDVDRLDSLHAFAQHILFRAMLPKPVDPAVARASQQLCLDFDDPLN